ncbi:hypothetical protein AB6D11_00160 [Vibrio splendidus]
MLKHFTQLNLNPDQHDRVMGGRDRELLALMHVLNDQYAIRDLAKKEGIQQDILDRLGYPEWGESMGKAATPVLINDSKLSIGRSHYLGIPCVIVKRERVAHVYLHNDHLQLSMDLASATKRRAAYDTAILQWEALRDEHPAWDDNADLAVPAFLNEVQVALREHRLHLGYLFRLAGEDSQLIEQADKQSKRWLPAYPSITQQGPPC